MDQELFLKAKSLAYKLLADRSRTVQEIRNKLLAKGIPPEIVSQVISDLKRSRYLDDEEYIRNWVQSRLRTKAYGPQRIKEELFHKGLSQEVVERIVAEVYEEVDLVELARKALGKKGQEKNLDIKARQRLYSYLWRRGFPEEVIREVVSK
jgi:regulatory protein